jgi:hypothetical protein
MITQLSQTTFWASWMTSFSGLTFSNLVFSTFIWLRFVEYLIQRIFIKFKNTSTCDVISNIFAFFIFWTTFPFLFPYRRNCSAKNWPPCIKYLFSKITLKYHVSKYHISKFHITYIKFEIYNMYNILYSNIVFVESYFEYHTEFKSICMLKVKSLINTFYVLY